MVYPPNSSLAIAMGPASQPDPYVVLMCECSITEVVLMCLFGKRTRSGEPVSSCRVKSVVNVRIPKVAR